MGLYYLYISGLNNRKELIFIYSFNRGFAGHGGRCRTYQRDAEDL